MTSYVSHTTVDCADGTGWAVLAEPEDNEFCLLRSEAEVTGSRS
jgi:hypothetical protein